MDWLFPFVCVLCQKRSQLKKDICHDCLQALPWLELHCLLCALPLEESDLCGACQKSRPAFDKVFALWQYQDEVQKFIYQLKFARKIFYSRLAGELLADKFSEHYEQHGLPDCVVPIPLHKHRLLTRRYNQATELAKPLANRVKRPLILDWLARPKKTNFQARLAFKKRQTNVCDAFSIFQRHNYRHVALVDDVITTGHTVNSVSHLLKCSGVQKIDVWCVARTGK